MSGKDCDSSPQPLCYTSTTWNILNIDQSLFSCIRNCHHGKPSRQNQKFCFNLEFLIRISISDVHTKPNCLMLRCKRIYGNTHTTVVLEWTNALLELTHCDVTHVNTVLNTNQMVIFSINLLGILWTAGVPYRYSLTNSKYQRQGVSKKSLKRNPYKRNRCNTWFDDKYFIRSLGARSTWKIFEVLTDPLSITSPFIKGSNQYSKCFAWLFIFKVSLTIVNMSWRPHC